MNTNVRALLIASALVGASSIVLAQEGASAPASAASAIKRAGHAVAHGASKAATGVEHAAASAASSVRKAAHKVHKPASAASE